MTSARTASRVEPCLLGGMLGDAWGGACEGRVAQGVVEFPIHPRISDDTQLVLATCEAIVEQGGRVDPAAVAERIRVWFTSGRLTGLGSSTLKSVRDLAAGAHWALAGARGERAAGNGAAMRAAPLAFFLDPTLDENRQVLRDVARITHHHDEAYAGSLAVVLAIRCSARLPCVPSDLLARVARDLPDSAVRDRIRELEALSLAEAARLGTSGYAVDSVPLALRIASEPAITCKAAIGAVLSVGGDTDTIASLAAQVLGAGGVAAPSELLDRIPEAAGARRIFMRLAGLVDQVD